MRLNYILLIIVTILVFGNTLSNDYNFDDELVTQDHSITKKGSQNSIVDIFRSSYHAEYGYSYGYRPITTLSFWLENRVFKESSKVSHLINLLLYTLSILLLYLLLNKIFTSINPFILLFITLLFVVHAVHSEVVASIKNRDELLAFLFLEIAIYFSIKFIKGNKVILLLPIFFSVILSLLSKKSGASITLILPLFFYVKNQFNYKTLLYLVLCYSIPIALFLFNFDLTKGSLIFLVSLLTYSFIFYVSTIIDLAKLVKGKPWYFMLPFFLSLILFFIGVSHHEHILVLISFATLLFYINFKPTLVFVLLIGTSFLGYFFFLNNLFLLYTIFLTSILMLQTNIKIKQLIIVGLGLFISIVLFILRIGEWIYGVIFLIPLIVFITAKINRILPIIITGISVLLGAVFFTISVFHIGLIIGSILVLSIESSKFHFYLKNAVFVWTIVIFFVSGYTHYQSNGSFFQTIEQKQEIVIEKTKSNTLLQEGRKLEYMENTLVAPHSIEQRVATGFVVLGEYFRLMVFPKELSFYYGYSKIETTDFTDYKVWVSLIIHLGLVLLMVYCYKYQPLISFGILWYLIAILLFSNWPVLIAGMVGERLAYIASIGFCIAIGGALNLIKPSFNLKKPRGIELIALSILIILSVRTIARNNEWRNPETLMSNDILHLKGSAQANYMFAMNLVKDVVENTTPSPTSYKKLQRSIYHFNRAIEIYPKFYNYQFDLGRTYVVLEDYEKAKIAFYKAYLLEPDALFSLDELVKTSFDLSEYNDVIKFGQLYININKQNAIIYELTAYSAFLDNQLELSRKIANEGLQEFPNNENLHGLLLDINNKISF